MTCWRLRHHNPGQVATRGQQWLNRDILRHGLTFCPLARISWIFFFIPSCPATPPRSHCRGFPFTASVWWLLVMYYCLPEDALRSSSGCSWVLGSRGCHISGVAVSLRSCFFRVTACHFRCLLKLPPFSLEFWFYRVSPCVCGFMVITALCWYTLKLYRGCFIWALQWCCWQKMCTLFHILISIETLGVVNGCFF